MRNPMRIGLTAVALTMAMTLTACGDKSEGEKPATQVAAKVNSDEITVHQLNHELGKLTNLSPEQAGQAANQVLRSMVDQQVLVQQAIVDKLDRDPNTLQKLEAARRQILAQAYVDKITANVAAPTEEEIADYYAKHPELFSERRIYRLQEISVQVSPDNAEAVKQNLAQAKNLGEFMQWLKEQNIPARAGQSTKTAEQLPMELLPRLHQLKDGQAMTFNAGGALNVVVIADSQTQPMSQEQARPVIERFLVNAKKREMAAANLKTLKETAKIEYLGAYSEAGAETESDAAAPTAPAAPVPPAAPETPAASDDADASAIEKGLGGLK